jgi:hypothetical protein
MLLPHDIQSVLLFTYICNFLWASFVAALCAEPAVIGLGRLQQWPLPVAAYKPHGVAHRQAVQPGIW